MRALYVSCCAALVMISLLTLSLVRNTGGFHGIADSREVIISADESVEVKEIHVVPGQRVYAGDTLLELYNPSLALRISEAMHRMDELRSSRSAHRNLSRSENLTLAAEREAKVKSLRAQIAELESQYRINKTLVGELRSVTSFPESGDVDAAESPLAIRLRSLREELSYVIDTARISQGHLASEQSVVDEPLAEQIRRLEDELTFLHAREASLVIAAKQSGTVGSINCKDGENVQSFTAIMTLHTEAPSFVKGYIHENTCRAIVPGEKVVVRTLSATPECVEGEIIGVGARIVEFPGRLRKAPDIEMWGREVSIRIPEKNHFLLGEKVFIEKKKSGTPFDLAKLLFPVSAHAEESLNVVTTLVNDTGRIILCPFAELPPLEASGIVYLNDIDRLCVVSDESPKDGPVLYLMNRMGIVERVCRIEGLTKQDDIESIAEDSTGALWILSSNSPDKKGKLPVSRTFLTKMQRSGDRFSSVVSVSLQALLVDAVDRNRATIPHSIAKALKNGSFECEGLTFDGTDILLGVKQPMDSGKAVVLRIRDGIFLPVSDRIESNDLVVDRLIAFPASKSGTAERLTDLFIKDHIFYVSTASRNEGALWRIDGNSSVPLLLKSIPGNTPEGICWIGTENQWMIVCDNGPACAARYFTFRGPV